jgi:hypothetical protein
MPVMRFSKLYLLSQNEQRALAVDFTARKTVLVAGNGYGKSAILKSLYETLGAPPQKVEWQDGADVTSLLDFTIDGQSYAALRLGKSYTLFDSSKKVLISTDRVVLDLGPTLADLLNFRLVLNNRKDEPIVPPPSYAFAPFYIDQDTSWQRPWSGFKDLQMLQGATRALGEFHSGMRPNAYYEAKARRDALKRELQTIDDERSVVAQAFRRVSALFAETKVILELEHFEMETKQLLMEVNNLQVRESEYRSELADLHEEQHVWANHVAMLEEAIGEQDATFKALAKQPADVECPVCGQHYSNGLIERFDLRTDLDDLVAARQLGRTKLNEASHRFRLRSQQVEEIREAIGRVELTFAIRKEDVSLKDVIASQGRAEALVLLRDRLNELDAHYGEKGRKLEEAESRLKAADDPKRKREIRNYFATQFRSATQSLDVRHKTTSSSDLYGANIGRGSETPRAMAAYYFSFLQTVYKYSASAFCPIVIDAPNQQGQDEEHLDDMVQYLLSALPADVQVIVGIEAVNPEMSEGAAVINVSNQKNQVLREDQYEPVKALMNSYFMQLLLT